MVDPTSELEENVDEADAPQCATCGARVAMEPTHRVRTWVEDGTVQTAHFCDDDCYEDWDSETA
jgi:hypothetical protein